MGYPATEYPIRVQSSDMLTEHGRYISMLSRKIASARLCFPSEERSSRLNVTTRTRREDRQIHSLPLVTKKLGAILLPHPSPRCPIIHRIRERVAGHEELLNCRHHHPCWKSLIERQYTGMGLLQSPSV